MTSDSMLGTIIHLSEIELVPVVEVEPYRYVPDPTGAITEDPAARLRRWDEFLGGVGLSKIEPIIPSTWLFPADRLSDPADLARLLDRIVVPGDSGDRWAAEKATPLCGGFALVSAGRVIVEPACCSDLGELPTWGEAAAWRSPEWTTVWIGHPWISARFDSGRLILSDPHEDDSHPTPRWSVSPEDLARAVAVAGAALEGFALRVEAAVAVLGGRNADEAARRLAGLPNHQGRAHGKADAGP